MILICTKILNTYKCTGNCVYLRVITGLVFYLKCTEAVNIALTRFQHKIKNRRQNN